MSAGVVIKVDNSVERTAWTRLLEAFRISEIYELPGLGQPLEKSIKIETLSDLANYHEADLVVLAAIDGDFVQGQRALVSFEHPEEAIYIFGGSMTRLSQADLLGETIVESLYIEAGDLFPSQAGAVVLWDRYVKRLLL